MDYLIGTFENLLKKEIVEHFYFKLLNSALKKGNLVATRMDILRVEGGSEGTVAPFSLLVLNFGVFKIAFLLEGLAAWVIIISKSVDL